MIGGVRRDITPEMYPKIKESMDYLKGQFGKLKKVFLEDKTFKMRSQGCGILTKEDALKLAAVGPTARASGVKIDTRLDQSYFAYGDLDFDYITPDVLTGEVNGDVYDRIIVRLLEVQQSISLIEQCLERMPDGPIVSEPKIAKLLAKLKKAEGEGIGRMEAPRGEVFHYVKMTANENIYSWKVRAPTYANIMPWVPMLKGGQIADIPIVAASTDPCMSCTNRVLVVDNKKTVTLDKEELHQRSIQKTRRLTA